MSTDPQNTNQNLNKMKTIIAIVLLVAASFLASGCATTMGATQARSYRDGTDEIYRMQYAKCAVLFPQYGNWIWRGDEVRDGYQQWHIVKREGSRRSFTVWLDDQGKTYGYPNRDGEPPKPETHDGTEK